MRPLNSPGPLKALFALSVGLGIADIGFIHLRLVPAIWPPVPIHGAVFSPSPKRPGPIPPSLPAAYIPPARDDVARPHWIINRRKGKPAPLFTTSGTSLPSAAETGKAGDDTAHPQWIVRKQGEKPAPPPATPTKNLPSVSKKGKADDGIARPKWIMSNRAEKPAIPPATRGKTPSTGTQTEKTKSLAPRAVIANIPATRKEAIHPEGAANRTDERITETDSHKRSVESKQLSKYPASLGALLVIKPVSAHTIGFSLNGRYLNATAKRRLRQIAGLMALHPAYQARIEGHTDSVGKARYNQWLSEVRAGQVAAFLRYLDIDASRIHTRGFGETHLLVPERNRRTRRRNRRVDIKIESHEGSQP